MASKHKLSNKLRLGFHTNCIEWIKMELFLSCLGFTASKSPLVPLRGDTFYVYLKVVRLTVLTVQFQIFKMLLLRLPPNNNSKRQSYDAGIIVKDKK